MFSKVMNRRIAVALLCLVPLFAVAQELKVESFRESTMSIMDVSMQQRDNNNDICAIVKVLLPLEGAEFEGVFDYFFHTSEYWVYMSPGKKYLRVICPMRKPLMIYIPDYIGEGVRAKTIYELDVSGYPESAAASVEAETHQYLALTVSPKNARVEIDGEEQEALDENGGGSYYLEKGMHTYTVSATGYASQSGSVEIRDERLSREIILESTKARLTVTCATPGVSIYVNEQLKGTGNWAGDMLAATYRVEARKEGHRPQSQTVTLVERDNREVTFPALEEIRGSLRVDYKPVNVEVWIDGKKTGLSPDRFSVMVGSHRVELRKTGYVSKTESVSVREGDETVIGGSLSKETTEVVSSQGNAEWQNEQGEKYYYGRGVEQDYAKSVEWYRKSAEQGNADGQNNLGDCYQYGHGVERDYAKAVEWYRKAAEQGDSWGQNNLGYCYDEGHGVEQDYAKAVEWYRKSAEQGNSSGQYNLGYCYEHGHGVEQDYAKAVEWYRKAAEQGNAGGQNNLGYCYEHGHGVERDYAKAVEWYRKSVEQGNASAIETLKLIKNPLLRWISRLFN